MRRAIGAVAVLSVAVFAAPAVANAATLEFRAVADKVAVLHDGPTSRSPKLFVVSRGYPVEVIVVVDGWAKVRDAAGSFGWIETKQLTDKRTVMVKVPVADVRAKPDETSPVAFQAQQNVVLDYVGASGGWVQVRHRDGSTGYVRSQQVWGA